MGKYEDLKKEGWTEKARRVHLDHIFCLLFKEDNLKVVDYSSDEVLFECQNENPGFPAGNM